MNAFAWRKKKGEVRFVHGEDRKQTIEAAFRNQFGRETIYTILRRVNLEYPRLGTYAKFEKKFGASKKS